jgi:chromosome segregation ATPase
MNKKILTSIIVATLFIHTGCQTIDAVITDAQELQTNVSTKIIEIRDGIDNIVNETKETYESLLEKKRQLEEMVVQIQEAVNAINQLLGKTNTDTQETEDLQATIEELRKALNDAESTLEEVDENMEVE